MRMHWQGTTPMQGTCSRHQSILFRTPFVDCVTLVPFLQTVIRWVLLIRILPAIKPVKSVVNRVVGIRAGECPSPSPLHTRAKAGEWCFGLEPADVLSDRLPMYRR